MRSLKLDTRQSQIRTWYEQHATSIFNTCLRMVNHREDARDMVQESFIKAYKSFDQFNPELASPATWIRSIAVNHCINHIKRKRKIYFDDQDKKSVEDVELPTFDQDNREQQIKRIRESMKNLPDGYRVVLSLYLFEGYDHREIADILSISESTSKSQYSRAKKKLIALLNEQYEF